MIVYDYEEGCEHDDGFVYYIKLGKNKNHS